MRHWIAGWGVWADELEPSRDPILIERQASWRWTLGAWPGCAWRIPLGAVLRAMAHDVGVGR